MSIKLTPDEPRATRKQIEFADALFIDLGFEPADKRKFLEDGYGHKYIDELTVKQASALIGYLIDRKRQMEIDRQGKLEL